MDKPDFADSLEAQLIADAVSSGETLIDACRMLDISSSTIYRKINGSARFAQMMDEARSVGFDVIAENIRKVTRGVAGHSSGDVKRDRLIAEYDAKLLAKWHPKRYGEKLEIEQKSSAVTIPVGDDPVAAARVYEQLIKGN